jgi:hypothetical protein
VASDIYLLEFIMLCGACGDVVIGRVLIRAEAMLQKVVQQFSGRQERPRRCLSVFSAYPCLSQVIRTTTAAQILAFHVPLIVFLIGIE